MRRNRVKHEMLGAELVEYGGAGNVRFLGDVLHGRLVQAPRGEQLLRGLEDELARFIAIGPDRRRLAGPRARRHAAAAIAGSSGFEAQRFSTST